MAGYFQEIFNVELLHNYYATEPGQDFMVHVPKETRTLMDLYKLQLSPDGPGKVNTFGLLMEGSKDTEFTPDTEASEAFSLAFLLELKNANLPNFTVLPDLAPNEVLHFYNRDSDTGGPNYLYDNLDRDGVTGKLNHATIFLYSKSFSHTFSGTANSTLTVTLNYNGEPVRTQAVSSLGDEYTVAMDVSNLPSGQYVLDTSEASIPLYLVDELPSKPLLAMVEIRHTTETGSEIPFQYSEPTKYKVQLERLDVFWKYFVVAKQSMSGLHIDAIASPPSPYPSPVSFTEISPGAEEAETMAQVQDIYGTSHPILVFKSDDVLPYSDVKLVGLQLSSSSATVIENLPNPPLGSSRTDQVLCIAPSFVFPIDERLDNADDYQKSPSK